MGGALNQKTYFDINLNIIFHIFPQLPTRPLPLGFQTKLYTYTDEQMLDQFRPAQISLCFALLNVTAASVGHCLFKDCFRL